MEKRTDIQIYELAYKPVSYGFWDNSLYTPIQCGASDSKENVCELKDNTGDNISSKNFFYSETTGTYWIWKNAPHTDYVGQCQYRRRLSFDEAFPFKGMLDKYGVICNKPLFLGRTVRRQLQLCHPQIDTEAFEDIVYHCHPEFARSFNHFFNYGYVLFFSSSYIMRWDDFDDYCNFLFPVLNEYEHRFGFDKKERLEGYVKNKMVNATTEAKQRPISYHMLIGGFLQERLFTAWCLTRFKQHEIYYKDFTFMEPDMKLKSIKRR